MEKVFNELKHTLVKQNGVDGCVCGYTDSHLLIATTQDNSSTFRRIGKKEAFILEEYKSSQFKYSYIDEADVLKQIKKDGKTTREEREDNSSLSTGQDKVC